MRKRKINIYLLLIILVLGLALGYAYLTANLTISGATAVSATNWDVHFENVQVITGSVEGTEPTIGSDTTTLSFSTRLSKPGDFYAFYVDVKNSGSIDAMISEVVSKINNQPVTSLPAYLEYTATYADEHEIEENHLLAAGEKDTYYIRIGFKKDISAGDLPSSAQELNISFATNFLQRSSSAVARNKYVFTLYDTELQIGDTLPPESELTRYPGPYDSFLVQNGVFIRMQVNENDVVQRAWVGFNPYGDGVHFFEGYTNTGAVFLAQRDELDALIPGCIKHFNVDIICGSSPGGYIEERIVALETNYAACWVTETKWVWCQAK